MESNKRNLQETGKMTGRSQFSFFILSFIFIVLASHYDAEAFIQKEYSLQEVLSECSNVLFGTVTEVDPKRMTAKVKPEENLKGETKFSQIKINIGVGQGNFPQQLIRKFKVGEPVIIFYKDEGGRIASVGHIGGIWFQIFAPKRSERSKTWWNFTHIEIYMHRTYKGPTVDFQSHLRQVFAGKIKPKEKKESQSYNLADAPKGAIRVMVLNGSHYDVEFTTLTDFDQVANHKIVYQKTTNRDLPGIEKADLLWIGQGVISNDKYLLTSKQEKKIKAFVKSGGVAIVSSQDSDDGRPCEIGWVPEPIKGIESMGRSDFKATEHAGSLFDTPNQIRSGEVFLDDTWSEWSSKYVMLATTNAGKNVAVAMLRYGRGMYLLTGFQNETTANVFVNRLMIENLIYFATNWLKE